MQAATDATALMIAREAIGLSATELETRATKYFRALLARPDLTAVTLNAAYTTDAVGQSVKLSASASLPNSFMSMAMLGGKQATELGTSATARWGARYRVAIALDNTGSMASASKMTELKKAAKAMIEDFASMAKTAEDVYISIIPFSVDVNVGADKVNETWLNWDYFGQCWNTSSNKVDKNKVNKSDCTKTNNREWKEHPRTAWTGCVPDRDDDHIGNHDLKNTLPNVAAKETLYDPVAYDDCPVSMMGMTSVYSKKQDLLNKIDSMIPKGNTNQGVGLHWAWMTHGQGPFPSPTKLASVDYKDVIILLTDGDNTENRWSTNGNTIDNRQKDLCSNLKSMAPKMSIYTVQVATGGDSVQSALKNCASFPNDPAFFSYITNATQLSTKFKNIFESIARLRVTS